MNERATLNEEKLRVAILGTGKIGTDLLIKILRSPVLECAMFAGRNLSSAGMRKALELNVPVSDRGINEFIDNPGLCDLVFDATSAHHHREHAQIFRSQGIKAIDLTPARVGSFCIPAINEAVICDADNINMVTCGGQASVPVAAAVRSVCSEIHTIAVHTLVAADSIGQATLDNIDDYYETTAGAITDHSDAKHVSVDLEVDHGEVRPTMTTRLRFELPHYNWAEVNQALLDCEMRVRLYAPGFRLVLEPSMNPCQFEVKVSVRGLGDWVPEYAGNLDIINCASIACAEHYSRASTIEEIGTLDRVIGGAKRFMNKYRETA